MLGDNTQHYPACSYGQSVLKDRNMQDPEFCNLLSYLSVLGPSYLICSLIATCFSSRLDFP